MTEIARDLFNDVELGLPKAPYEGLNPDEVIERLAPPDRVDWDTGLYTAEVLTEELKKFIARDDSRHGLYASGITIDDFENLDDKQEALRTLGLALLETRDLLLRSDLPARIGENGFVVVKLYKKSETGNLRTNLEIEEEIFSGQEDRLRVATGTLVKKLPLLSWNNSFYRSGDTPETFIERADPHGSYMDLTRSHRQGAVEYTKLKQRAQKAISSRNIRRAS